MNIKNIKDNDNYINNNKLLTNELFLNSNNNNKEKLDLKIDEKYDYLKLNFCKDIFSLKKKDTLYNNISTSNYKLLKEKEKPNIFLKNKSNMSNDEIDFSIANTRAKSKNDTNLIGMRNSIITGNRENKSKVYKLKKCQDSIDFNNKKEKNNLFKNSILAKRPTSCVNKKYEGIMNNTNTIQIERNKKVIRFSKQDKKIYLRTNTDKKIPSSKKAKINLENINNIEINLNVKAKNEDEDKKENNIIKEIDNVVIKDVQIQNNKSSKRNIFTDISLKNFKEASSNKKVKIKNKVILF